MDRSVFMDMQEVKEVMRSEGTRLNSSHTV